jgi:hypothetical protein
MITVDTAKELTLERLRSLKVEDFSDSRLATSEEKERMQAIAARLFELDPSFKQFLDHARPNLMSKFGSPGTFVNRVESMCPFEVLYTWSKLTEGGQDDIEFIKVVHKHMAYKILEVFDTPKEMRAVYTTPSE